MLTPVAVGSLRLGGARVHTSQDLRPGGCQLFQNPVADAIRPSALMENTFDPDPFTAPSGFTAFQSTSTIP